MPLRTETYDFDEEIDRIEDEIDDLEEVIEAIDEGNPQAPAVMERYQSLQTHLQGVRWARDEAFEADYADAWDEDVDAVTLGGLTGGEFGKIQDDAQGSGSGAARIYQVEAGTVDAPYLDDGMDDDERIATVSGLPIHYLMWAEARIDDLTGLGGNGQLNYDELLAQATADE